MKFNKWHVPPHMTDDMWQLILRMTCDIWKVTFDRGYLKNYRWHLTWQKICFRWHVTDDIWENPLTYPILASIDAKLSLSLFLYFTNRSLSPYTIMRKLSLLSSWRHYFCIVFIIFVIRCQCEYLSHPIPLCFRVLFKIYKHQ